MNRIARLVRSRPAKAIQRRVPNRIKEVLGRRVFDMPEAEAARVLAVVGASGRYSVLAGGWGIDAITPGRPRRHFDLDIIIREQDETVFRRLLADLGYQEATARSPGGWWAPWMAVYRSELGQVVELLLLDDDGLSALRDSAEQASGRPVIEETTVGRVGPVEVTCLSAELQAAAHLGYRRSLAQHRDIRHLRSLTRG